MSWETKDKIINAINEIRYEYQPKAWEIEKRINSVKNSIQYIEKLINEIDDLLIDR